MTKKLMVGKVAVGGGAPVSIQSMCNTKTDDVAATVAQIHALEDAGCEIIRVAVPDEDAAKAVDKIKEQIAIPLIADIHFNYKLALMCAERGIDALRINPGNIGGEEKVKAVADICRQKNIPIRIGVNGGSLEKHILAKYGAPVPEAMVESALYHVRLLEKFDFNNIVISIKNSNVPRMMEAYRQLSAVTDYPLHVGVTEAGTYQMGLLKSGMGIGGMLLEGIGDTIRVSLAAEPEKEVEAGYNILRAVGFPVAGPEVITCPTCGRTQYPCTEIANEVEKRLQGCKKSIKVAVMGCVVNGPGEAREADIGIAGGDFALMDDGKLKLDSLPASCQLLEGDLVVTSGLGGYLPPDLVIGSVSELRADDSDTSNYAILTPAADLNGLTEVCIIKSFEIVS